MGETRPERKNPRMAKSPQKRTSTIARNSRKESQISVLRPGEKNILSFFGVGSPPVEADLRESRALGLRIEPSAIFTSARYRHDSAYGSGRLEIACPDSRSGLILRPSGSKSKRKDYRFLIPLQLRLSRSDHQVQSTRGCAEKSAR